MVGVILLLVLLPSILLPVVAGRNRLRVGLKLEYVALHVFRKMLLAFNKFQ